MPAHFFTSDSLTSNHYILFIPKSWKTTLITVLKYETGTSLTFCVDSTGIDAYKYELFSRPEDYNLQLPRILRVDNYYSLSARTRYTVLEGSNQAPFSSSTGRYKNALWLERELCEMYGVTCRTIHDSRNLLLEYTFSDTPMLKNYPTEGFVDIYYDFFRDQLCYVSHDYIEL